MRAQGRIRRWLTSLRARMLLTFWLVALVPLVTLALLDVRAARASLTAASYRSLEAAASQTANRLDQFFESNLEVIETQAAQPMLADYLVALESGREDPQGEKRVRETLASFAVKDRIFISSSALLDIRGRDVIDTTSANEGHDESERPYFREALETNLPYASLVLFVHDTGRPSFYFSSPVRDANGRIVGVLRTEYNAAVLQQLLIADADLIGAWSFPLLVDDDRILLAYGAASHIHLAHLLFKPTTPLSPERLEALRTARRLPHGAAGADAPALSARRLTPFSNAEIRLEGQLAFQESGPWAAAVRRLSHMPWSVVFVQPEHVFLAPVNEHKQKTQQLTLAYTALVALIALGVAHLLSRPVEHLTRVARRIAAGEFETRIHVRGGWEIGLLADSIEYMAGEVQRRERALRERAEELSRSQVELQNKTLILESILNSMSDGVVVADDQGRFLIWNDAATRILGADAMDVPPSEWSERYGLRMPDRVTPCPAEQLPLARALRGESVNHAELYVCNAREERCTWISVSARPLRSIEDRVRGGVAVFSDVTELRERADALRESHLRLQAFINNATAVISMKDLGGRFLLVNRRFEELFHVDGAQIIGKTDYDVFPTEIADAIRAHDEETLRAGEPRQWEEMRPHDDGPHTYLSVKFGLRDADGAVYAIGAFSTDITERKQAEQERTRLVEQLREAVRARDEFLAIASHELKTPLTPLKLQVQSLQRQLEGARTSAQVPTRVELALGNVDRQVNRLTTLIDNLLDVSRITCGQLRLTLEDVDLSAVVSEVIERFRSEITASRSPLELYLGPNLVGSWDRGRVEQLFTNLLTNALKYAGGKPIKVVTEPRGGAARLIVQDWGMGIAPEHRDRIFQPFERAVSYQNISGFGLGLYIVRQIVEAHRGKIHLESQLGRGSTFIVDLPLRPAARDNLSESSEATSAA